jgi:multidrug efflux system membrane fusion protein
MQNTPDIPPDQALMRVEQAEALHSEIARLPERYRATVVLCDLEGLTQQEAASWLRCPIGTVAVRLKRARERLKGRLERRGLAPPSSLIFLAPRLALSTSLIESTVKGSMASGVVLVSVLSLAKGVQMTMTLAKWRAAAVGLLVALGLATTWSLAGALDGSKPDDPLPTERERATIRAATREVRDYEDFAGRVEIYHGTITWQLNGPLETIYFPEGGEVKVGTPLFEIDAKRQTTKAKEWLEGLEANQIKFKARLDRATEALRKLEQLRAEHPELVKQAEADLALKERQEAEQAVKVNASQIRAATSELRRFVSWTQVQATFDGKIDRPLVKVGDPIVAHQTILAKYEATDWRTVGFDVDELTYQKMNKGWGSIIMLGDDAVHVIPDNESHFPIRGRLEHPNTPRVLDPVTGKYRFQVTIRDRDRIVIPGMSARVHMEISRFHEAVLIPESAIATDGNQKRVYVLDDQNVVETRPVQVGQSHDGFRVIIDGLKPGERVVVEDLADLKSGMTIKSKVAPNSGR